MNKEWLSLSGAAEILGVHPSTVRKWSDEGKIPVHLTQGGHRRYRISEVEAWGDSHNTGQHIDIDQLLDQVLHAVRVNIQNQSLESETWYANMDNETREHYRASGRSLAHAILFYLASSGENAENQAHSVGVEYASRSRKHRLSSTDATRVYLFFRAVVLDAILSAYKSMRGTSPSAWAEMLQRFNQFTDQVLLAIIENYEAYSTPK
jgi:excisionase family DNA binding protein